MIYDIIMINERCHVGNNELYPVKLNCHNFSLSIDQD